MSPTEEPNTDLHAWMVRFSPEDATAAAEHIETAFIWSFTPEGHKYWVTVADRLREMVREHRKSDQ